MFESILVIPERVQAIPRFKLSKKVLFQLPAGAFLVSGVGAAPDRPSFAENVSPQEARLAQWEKIKSVAVNGRTCGLYASKEEYQQHLKAFLSQIGYIR